MSDGKIKGKKILVIGGTSGIGKAVALLCAEQEAQVIIWGRSQEKFDEIVRKMPGQNHIFECVDLNDENDYDSILESIVKKTGKLDGMVYSAGIPGVIPMKMLQRKKMYEVMNVNFFSFVEVVRSFSKRKISNNGSSIVGISSAVVERGELCQTIYAASKAAMDAAIKCLSFELIKRQIRINSVLPGMTQTEMMDKVLESGSNPDALGATSLMGIGTPEEVANAVLFLLSDLSAHTTGRGLFVDGGCFL